MEGSEGRILKLEVMSLPRILDQENIGLQEQLSVHVAQSLTRSSRIIRQHVDHIRPRTADFPSDTEVDSDDWTD